MSDPTPPDQKPPDLVEIGSDDHGKIYLNRKNGHLMRPVGIANNMQEAIEAMLDLAVEQEMRRRYPDTYQEPETGHA